MYRFKRKHVKAEKNAFLLKYNVFLQECLSMKVQAGAISRIRSSCTDWPVPSARASRSEWRPHSTAQHEKDYQYTHWSAYLDIASQVPILTLYKSVHAACWVSWKLDVEQSTSHRSNRTLRRTIYKQSRRDIYTCTCMYIQLCYKLMSTCSDYSVCSDNFELCYWSSWLQL